MNASRAIGNVAILAIVFNCFVPIIADQNEQLRLYTKRKGSLHFIAIAEEPAFKEKIIQIRNLFDGECSRKEAEKDMDVVRESLLPENAFMGKKCLYGRCF